MPEGQRERLASHLRTKFTNEMNYELRITNYELKRKSVDVMGNVVEDKSYIFAVKVVKAVRRLKEETREYELLSQLLRSGTSIGANVVEAKYAQSPRDYVSKFSIARKEANEAKYWLRLLADTEIVGKKEAENMLNDVEELLRIIVSIIKTVKERNNL